MVVADELVLQVCRGVDPNSWEWIYRGCWIFHPTSLIPLFLPAAMLAVMLLSLRQVQGR